MNQKSNKDLRDTQKGFNKFVRFSTIAFEMGIIITAGTYGGVWLDDYFGFDTPFLTITLSLLSIFISLYLVIKQVNNANK